MLADISKPGVAKLMARMLTEGTRTKTPVKLEESIQMLGADISISASDESITVSGNTLSRNFEKSLALFEEMLLQPRWDTAQFTINKTRIINDLKRNKANPYYLASTVFDSLIFGKDNILSKNVSGTTASVESITMDDLKVMYKKALSPSVSEFMIVGDIEGLMAQKLTAPLKPALLYGLMPLLNQ